MVKLTEREQRDLLIGVGLADFLVGGKLTSVAKKALMATIRRGTPVVARTGVAVGRGLAFTPAGRALLAAGTLYQAYQNRDQLAEIGRDVIDDFAEAARVATTVPPSDPNIGPVQSFPAGGNPFRLMGGSQAQIDAYDAFVLGALQSGTPSANGLPSAVQPTPRAFGPAQTLGIVRPPAAARGGKKRKTKYSSMISRGMRAIKKAKKYGPAGKITSPKKAFTAVTKAASAKLKGKRKPRTGIKSWLWSRI